MSDLTLTPWSCVSAADLAGITEFRDLSPENLEWLASLMWQQTSEAGEALVREGSPADRMFIVLEGELHARRESVNDSQTRLVQQGQITGMLPFSRMREFPVTVRPTVRCRVACLSTSRFDLVLQRIPELGPRLVGVLSDRIRTVTREDVQRDKLIALGRLSAGLAHGLNNPAAAVVRAVDSMRDALLEWRAATSRLESLGLTAEQRRVLEECEQECVDSMKEMPALDSLTESDREEQLLRLLRQHGVKEPWRFSQVLVESGYGAEDLACVANTFTADALTQVLGRFSSTIAIERLLIEIATSARRISELVDSMKDYSHMDQAPVQEVDVNRGLESTLAILQHRLTSDITLTKEYDPSIPILTANGSELNQVWTNLIDNALDAIGEHGEIRIKTQLEVHQVVVEITDNGPGIPEEIRERIFEPFFTTKGVGDGNGLGLDIAYRAVRRHNGELRFESQPGCTRFQVRLPLRSQAVAAAGQEFQAAGKHA